jgi:quercetin dioxygenase-like cupin family protein
MIVDIEPKFAVTQNDTSMQVYHAKKGEGLPKHEHLYSHLVFCHAGRIVIRKEGREAEMTCDSQPINLVANEWHEIEALEDGTIFMNTFNLNSTGEARAPDSNQYNYFSDIRAVPGGLSQKDQLEMYLGSMIQKILAETIDSTV